MKPRIRRGSSKLCPVCMSTMLLTSKGEICSGDRFKIFKKDFKRFEKMKQIEKENFLKGLENPSQFLTLYENRDSLDCGYSNTIIDITPTYSTLIPDPIQVSRIEKQLGRKLTEEELEDNFIFYKKDNSIYVKKIENAIPFSLDRILFPDDV